MKKSDAHKIAGALAADLKTAQVGTRGVLLETMLDAENTDFLRLMAGLAPFGEPGADFSWTRDKDKPETITLDQRPFGIRLSAPTPELLAQGLDLLAHALDRAVVTVSQEQAHHNDKPEPDYPLEVERRLRRHFAVTPPDAPLGLATTLDAAAAKIHLPPNLAELWEERGHAAATEAVQDYSRNPEVQDHRPVIPVKSPPPPNKKDKT